MAKHHSINSQFDTYEISQLFSITKNSKKKLESKTTKSKKQQL